MLVWFHFISFTFRNKSKLFLNLWYLYILTNLNHERISKGAITHIAGAIFIPWLGCISSHNWMVWGRLLGDSIFLFVLSGLYGTINHLQINQNEEKQKFASFRRVSVVLFHSLCLNGCWDLSVCLVDHHWVILLQNGNRNWVIWYNRDCIGSLCI